MHLSSPNDHLGNFWQLVTTSVFALFVSLITSYNSWVAHRFWSQQTQVLEVQEFPEPLHGGLLLAEGDPHRLLAGGRGHRRRLLVLRLLQARPHRVVDRGWNAESLTNSLQIRGLALYRVLNMVNLKFVRQGQRQV